MKSPYERATTVPLELVFEAMAKGYRAAKFPGAKGVNLGGKRLNTFFTKGTTCACCGLEASFFAVERTKGQESPKFHLNLYGVRANGKEVIFTHDHILARSLGGKDVHENMRTMCGPCNWEKGRKEAAIGDKFRAGKITDEEFKQLIAELG